ncbi:MAG TPA: FAD-linked oxidase C-terminal domain-containing protein [Gaiellaceae bacterium]|nr:FAD-linked oxidase C-terminal domain-containing protein [Gaiellaceae bacterium]
MDVEALRAALDDPGRVSIGESDRAVHGEDMTFHDRRPPDLVIYPVSTEEVSRVLAIADEEGVPVTPFGAGSSLEGHVIPVDGGISIDLSRMDRIVSVEPGNLTATVQPGVTRLALERAAGEHGLWFPVDPGADATLGGMAATNAAGTTTIRFGKMRPNVLALEAVLPGGEVVRTGSRALKTSAGYDLTGLFVGSEGTLGVITELTLRLYGIPEHVAAARISFPSLEAACRTAVTAVAGGTGVRRLELLDEMNIRAINAYKGTVYPEVPSLFVEAAGSEGSVEDDLQLVLALAEEEGAVEVASERDADSRARLWEARHSAAYAWAHQWPGTRECVTDVCVPLDELPAAVSNARRTADRLELRAGILGHVGDGNFHVGVTVDPDDPKDVAGWHELSRLVVEDAVARGGTCTGEHGVGIGKMRALELEHPDLLPLYRGIKRLFDPRGIMNPGKVVRFNGERRTAAGS